MDARGVGADAVPMAVSDSESTDEGAGVAAGWQFERLQPRAGTGGGSAHGARGGYAQIPDTAPPDVPPGI